MNFIFLWNIKVINIFQAPKWIQKQNKPLCFSFEVIIWMRNSLKFVLFIYFFISFILYYLNKSLVTFFEMFSFPIFVLSDVIDCPLRNVSVSFLCNFLFFFLIKCLAFITHFSVSLSEFFIFPSLCSPPFNVNKQHSSSVWLPAVYFFLSSFLVLRHLWNALYRDKLTCFLLCSSFKKWKRRTRLRWSFSLRLWIRHTSTCP